MHLLMISALLIVSTSALAADWTPEAPAADVAAEETAPRDPFVPLVGGFASDPARGLEGMLLADLRLTSVAQTPTGVLATLENSATGAFFAKVGDRLKDGEVVEIYAERSAIVVRQVAVGPRGSRDVLLELGLAR